MKMHVNGWRTIEQQLIQQGRKQGEIAQLLKITPAAVSQVKKGVFLLNPKQLEKIASFLQFDDTLRSEFYTELFNARLLGGECTQMNRGAHYRVYRERHGSDWIFETEIPLGDLGLLADYAFPLETIRSYLLRNSSERYVGPRRGRGVCALRTGDEFEDVGIPQKSIILIESEGYPDSGMLSLACLRDGHYLLRKYVQDASRIALRPLLFDSGAELVLNSHEVSEQVLWIHPVLELTFRFNG